MPRKEHSDLLPGVSHRERPAPAASFDGRDSIARARRRANIRDIIDTVLLIGVDIFFVMWPVARFPFLTRQQSLMALMAVHAVYALHILATRIVPAMRARRVAATWDEKERTSFKKR